MVHTTYTAQGLVAGPQQDDLTLLRRIMAHDHQAFEALYRRYTPRLTRYLRTLLRSHELVEDILHDVWLVVWHQATRYQGTAQVSTWLFGIARHKTLKARAQALRAWPSLPPIHDPVDETDPVHRLIHQDQARLVQQALDTLPPCEREVFVLTYSYHYPAQTIAAYQDCTVATVRYRIRQARRRLAATLTAWGLAPQDLSQPLRRV